VIESGHRERAGNVPNVLCAQQARGSFVYQDQTNNSSELDQSGFRNLLLDIYNSITPGKIASLDLTLIANFF
jgi:hypothetical protein